MERNKHIIVSKYLLLFFLSIVAYKIDAKTKCETYLEQLFIKAKESGKTRLSIQDVPEELRTIISDIVSSGTRTQKQHQQLAEAVVSYLAKHGATAKIVNGYSEGINIIVDEVSKDSPFTWTKNVPEKLTKRFDREMVGVFNTDVILNPYSPGFKGGSAQFRPYFANGSSALVYSAQSLMSGRFHPPSDGHEAIHAQMYAGTTPTLSITSHKSKLRGKIGADLYGSEFPSEEIHSTYPFSIRTALKDIEPGQLPEATKDDTLNPKELTLIRNSILQGLFETAEPAYQEILKPGAITKKTIREYSGWGGDRLIEINTADNKFYFTFQSEQVNRWKLEKDPKASPAKDWSMDPKTVREMIQQDYLATQKGAKETDWLVQNLIAPNAPFNSFREVTSRISQLRDFTTLGDPKSSKQAKEEAAERIVIAGADGSNSEKNLQSVMTKRLLDMQKKAANQSTENKEGVLYVQTANGSWTKIDANKPTKKSPAERLVEILEKF